MNQQPSNQSTDNGQKDSAIKKIIKNIPSSVLIIAVLSLFVISIVAVFRGYGINIYNYFIATPPLVKDENALYVSDFNREFPNFFDAKCNKEQCINVVRQLISKIDETNKMEKIIYYKIAMAELMISGFGNSIDTTIPDEDRVEAYKKIQVALKAINFYKGKPDGNQEQTNKAVVDFQTSYNNKYKKDIIPKDELGYFGYYTCFAIGKWGRNQPADAQASTE